MMIRFSNTRPGLPVCSGCILVMSRFSPTFKSTWPLFPNDAMMLPVRASMRRQQPLVQIEQPSIGLVGTFPVAHPAIADPALRCGAPRSPYPSRRRGATIDREPVSTHHAVDHERAEAMDRALSGREGPGDFELFDVRLVGFASSRGVLRGVGRSEITAPCGAPPIVPPTTAPRPCALRTAGRQLRS